MNAGRRTRRRHILCRVGNGREPFLRVQPTRNGAGAQNGIPDFLRQMRKVRIGCRIGLRLNNRHRGRHGFRHNRNRNIRNSCFTRRGDMRNANIRPLRRTKNRARTVFGWSAGAGIPSIRFKFSTFHPGHQRPPIGRNNCSPSEGLWSQIMVLVFQGLGIQCMQGRSIRKRGNGLFQPGHICRAQSFWSFEPLVPVFAVHGYHWTRARVKIFSANSRHISSIKPDSTALRSWVAG